MVLAAGLGTRMRPLTDNRPKPLIEVAGTALIDHALDRFAAAGVERAVVNVHYLADQIEDHLRKRERPQVLISDERDRLLETGGGLKKARSLLGDGPVFCVNTDAILVDGPGEDACARLARAFDPEQVDALLLLAPIDRTSGYEGNGDFHLEADGTLAYRGDATTAPYVYTGLQIIEPRLVDDGPDGPFSLRRAWDLAASRGAFKGVVHDGDWMHVGDPAGLKAAEARMLAHR
ncbi:MAG: NTP transferase domain-containing protein [Alphaproteobacteria bacterium]|nr:NTP transferase domain-containing protein [Alphaproteobacteria bacterium]